MTSTEVAALHGSPNTAAAEGGVSSATVTVEVDKHGDTSETGSGQEIAGKELCCDVTACDSCDPTPYTSMTDLSVKDHATLMDNQPGCL